MRNGRNLVVLFISFAILAISACHVTRTPSRAHTPSHTAKFYPNSLPATRWWWFATEIKKPDVKHQLDWAKANNNDIVSWAQRPQMGDSTWTGPYVGAHAGWAWQSKEIIGLFAGRFYHVVGRRLGSA